MEGILALQCEDQHGTDLCCTGAEGEATADGPLCLQDCLGTSYVCLQWNSDHISKQDCRKQSPIQRASIRKCKMVLSRFLPKRLVHH